MNARSNLPSQKCDANHPCAPCIDAGLERDCTRDIRTSQSTYLVPIKLPFRSLKLDFLPLWPNASTEGFQLESLLGPHNMRIAGTADGERDMKL